MIHENNRSDILKDPVTAVDAAAADDDGAAAAAVVVAVAISSVMLAANHNGQAARGIACQKP